MEKIKRMQALVKELNQYRNEYYNQAAPSVSDAVYDRLFDELAVTLDEEQIIALAFVPVMARSDERVEVISEAVKISHKVADEQQKIDIQSILFAFANKFLNDNELERIKEEIAMTQLGQMIYEDGLKKGEEKGEKKGKLEGKLEAAKALLDILSDEAIAKRLQLSLEQVKELRQEDQKK